MRTRILWGAAAVGVVALGLAGLAAKADDLFAFGSSPSTEPAIYRSDNTVAEDRLLARAAFTQVLSHKAEFLGMVPPANLQPYAPIFPDALIVEATQSQGAAAGGSVHYAAPGSLRTLINFYEDAAALQKLPFEVEAQGPDAVVFTAGDGRRQVRAKLTRQFANSTIVELSYS